MEHIYGDSSQQGGGGKGIIHCKELSGIMKSFYILTRVLVTLGVYLSKQQAVE